MMEVELEPLGHKTNQRAPFGHLTYSPALPILKFMYLDKIEKERALTHLLNIIFICLLSCHLFLQTLC